MDRPTSGSSILTAEEAIAYVHEHVGITCTGECSEIGDGNINFVYRIGVQGAAYESVILKKALPYIRCMGPTWKLGIERAHYEALSLRQERAVASDFVPEVYFSCSDDGTVVMQNIAPHVVLRDAMVSGVSFAHVGEHIGEYLGLTRYHLSVYSQKDDRFRALTSTFIGNYAMQKLSEGVIFEQPLQKGLEINSWPDTREMNDIVDRIQGSSEVQQRVGLALIKFRSQKEALLHGDLHTGSVMCTESATQVIDPEFSMIGPIGFDVGMFLANVWMGVHSRAPVDRRAPAEMAVAVWRTFEATFRSEWESERAANAVLDAVLDSIWDDALTYCAIEIIRRVIGVAHVKDFTSITDVATRAERECTSLSFAIRILLAKGDEGAVGSRCISRLSELAVGVSSSLDGVLPPSR